MRICSRQPSKSVLAAALSALLGMGLFSTSAVATPIGYGVEEATQDLYRIDLDTGVTTRVGATGGVDIEGLSMNPLTGLLYGIDDLGSTSSAGNLVSIDKSTGARTVIGALGFVIADPGLTFDSLGRLWAAGEDGTSTNNDVGFFYSIDLLTGAASLIGGIGFDVEGLAAIGESIFGITDDSTGNAQHGNGQTLVSINTTTGAGTFIGKTGIDSDDEIGMEADRKGQLYVSNEEHQTLYRVNAANASATLVGDMNRDFEGLAIETPEPAPVALMGLGLVLAALRRRV